MSELCMHRTEGPLEITGGPYGGEYWTKLILDHLR